MLYHSDVAWARGGFLGVDIFFVLSGYLITSLLLAERARWGTIDLRSFWIRRARRLLPALFAMLAFVGLAAPLYSHPDRLSQLRGDAFATLAYVANWRFIATGQSYFDQFAAPSPLRHVWSLGIEEQWYWLYPLLLIGLIAFVRRRRSRVAIALAVLAVLSAIEMLVLADRGVDQSRLYYGTDTRAQELLVGSLLAVLLSSRAVRGVKEMPVVPRPVLGSAVTWLGLGGTVLVLAFAQDSSGWLYHGGFLLFCAFVALLLWGLSLAPGSMPSRALGWRPLVVIGLVSYGLYLWHWPVFLLLTPDRTGLSGATLVLLRFAVTGAVAALSYVALERPVRAGVLRRRLGPGLAAVAAALSVAVVVGCVVVGTSGAVAVAAIDRSGTYETRIVPPSIGQTPVLILGDSPGRFLSWYLPRDVLSSYALSSSTVIGCGLLPQTVVSGDKVTPTESQCTGWPAEWKRAADLAKPAAVVLSTGYWELYDKQIDGRILRVGTPEYASALLEQLERVRSIATGDNVPLLLLNVPCMEQEAFDVGGADLASQANDPVRQAAVNDVLEQFQRLHPAEVSVLDDRSMLCPGGKYSRLLNGVEVRPDGVHVGGPGGLVVGAWLKPLLDKAVEHSNRARTVVVGDSIAYSLIERFDARKAPEVQPWGTTKIGCGIDPFTYRAGGRDFEPAVGCDSARQGWPGRIAPLHPNVALIIAGNAEMFDRVVNGEVVTFGSEPFRQALFAQFDAAIRDTGAATAAVVTSPCRHMPDGGTDPQAPVVNDPVRLAELNDMVRLYADQHPRVRLLDLNGYLCPRGFDEVKDGVTLRSDGVHFTAEGSALVWDWLGPQVAQVARGGEAG